MATTEDLLQDRDVQKLIVTMKHWRRLKPKVGSAGKPTYPIMSVLGLPEEDNLLTEMYERELLKRNVSSTYMSCPNCNGLSLGIRGQCPQCRDPSIRFEDMIEHTCGAISPRSRFSVTSDGQMKCPKCSGMLRKKAAKVIGRTYSCSNCGGSFEEYTPVVICHNCLSEFNLNSGFFQDIYEYELNEESAALSKALQTVAQFSSIGSVLDEAGFTVQMQGQLVGASGLSYVSNILAKKAVDGKTFVATIDGELAQAPVNASRIAEITPKILDAKPNLSVFIAIPGLDEKAANLAKQMNLIAIEANDVSDASTKVRDLLAERGLQGCASSINLSGANHRVSITKNVAVNVGGGD